MGLVRISLAALKRPEAFNYRAELVTFRYILGTFMYAAQSFLFGVMVVSTQRFMNPVVVLLISTILSYSIKGDLVA